MKPVQWAASLILKWEAQDGTRFTLGYILRTSGKLWTDAVNWQPNTLGRLDLAHAYLSDLAQILGGSVRQRPKPSSWYVVGQDAKAPPISVALDHADDWLAAIDRYTASLETALATRGGE